MSLEVIFSSRFTREAHQQKGYIEDNRQGYGEKFVEETDKAVQRIKDHPEAWAKSQRGIRRVHLEIFANHAIRYQYDKRKNRVTFLRLTNDAQKN